MAPELCDAQRHGGLCPGKRNLIARRPRNPRPAADACRQSRDFRSCFGKAGCRFLRQPGDGERDSKNRPPGCMGQNSKRSEICARRPLEPTRTLAIPSERSTATAQLRIGKHSAVEQVVEVPAKLQPVPLGEAEPLVDREVESVEAGSAAEIPGTVPDSSGSRCREQRRIKVVVRPDVVPPVRQHRDRPRDVGSLHMGVRVRTVGVLDNAERHAATEFGNQPDAPAPDDGVQGAALEVYGTAFAEGQLVDSASDEAVPDVVARERLVEVSQRNVAVSVADLAPEFGRRLDVSSMNFDHV